MKKSVAFMISLICFLSGIVLGFLVSPVKHGFGNNSNSNNHIHYHYSKSIPEEPEE